jgi:hypothetical protein
MDQLKFKSDHIKTANFNTEAIQKKFQALKEVNKQIIKSSIPDLSKLHTTIFQ